MAKRIYVGNLPFSFTDEDLTKLFEPFGTVNSAQVITDKFAQNQSKGFGFVEMSEDAEADKAITDLNGQEHGGRPLKVNEARPREERPARDNRGGDRGGYSSMR